MEAVNQPGQGSTQHPSRRRAILAAVVLVILILLVGSAVALTGYDSTKKNQATVPKQQFPNQLTPASEIKVGTHRYVSPCQALTLSAAAGIFGKADASTRVTEDSLAVSIPASEEHYVANTQCRYKLAGTTVTVTAEQHVDGSDMKDLGNLFTGGSDEISTAKTLENKATASDNADARRLADKLEKSIATYNKYNDEFDEDKLAKLNFDGVILPDLFGDLKMIQGNVLYGVSTGGRGDSLTADDLAKYGKAFETIARNAKNTHLDQSPVPTILGNKDKIGSTKILEPCVILDGGTFKTIAGNDENDTVSRITLPIDANRDIVDKQVNKRVLFSNECERNYNGDPINTAVKLQLYQAKTTEYAQQFVKDFNDDTDAQPPNALQTSADEAYIFYNSVDTATNSYLFRVGPYVGLVDISSLTSGDESVSSASQDQYINAINLFTARIKQQL
jgi:hypothetical protein